MRRKKMRTFLLVLSIAAAAASRSRCVYERKDIFPGTVRKVQRFRRILRFRIAGSEERRDGFAAVVL